MKFEINLKSIDIIRAIIHAQIHNKVIWAISIGTAIIINGISVIGLWAMGFPLQETLSVFGNFLIWVFGLFSVSLVVTILSLVCNPKWRKGRIGLHKIEITDKGMIESTEYNRSEIYWPSIRKISSKPSGLYFLHSGAESFVIPRNSFKQNKGWQEFELLFYSLTNSGK